MSLSVIVPAYNVGSHLAKCLDSIVSQDVDGMEVIVVDDGSTDASGAIADRYAAQYPFLTVIHQKNCGLSAARNVGLRKSTGDFVSFVDGDDHLLGNIYSAQLATLNMHPDVDVIEFSVKMGKENDRHSCLSLGDVEYNDALDYWVASHGFRHCYAWNKIFHRRVLFNADGSMLQFAEGRHFEDAFFMADVFRKNPKIVSSSRFGYFYTDNPDGISSQVSAQNLHDLCDAQMEAAKALGIEFSNPLNASLACFYLDLLNRQLSARLLAGRPIDLPRCSVPIEKAEGGSMKCKTFIQNWFGISALVGVMRICYALTFKKFKTINSSINYKP